MSREHVGRGRRRGQTLETRELPSCVARDFAYLLTLFPVIRLAAAPSLRPGSVKMSTWSCQATRGCYSRRTWNVDSDGTHTRGHALSLRSATRARLVSLCVRDGKTTPGVLFRPGRPLFVWRTGAAYSLSHSVSLSFARSPAVALFLSITGSGKTNERMKKKKKRKSNRHRTNNARYGLVRRA